MTKFLVAMVLVVGLSRVTRADNYDLVNLDKLGSCKSEMQKEAAQLGISYLQAFVGWHMKEQMLMIHPDFIAWHSSLAGLLVLKPEYQAAVPFKSGQWTKEKYLETMAFLAFHNDITEYKVVPSRVDCVGEENVVLTTNFNGIQIRRDDKGCVTHGVPFGSPTKIELQFKSEKQVDGSVKQLVFRSYSYLDDDASAKVRDELAKIVKGPANIPFNPGSCKPYQKILNQFRTDAEAN